MARKDFQITIQSILGGQSDLSHFAREDEFFSSAGIDPALPVEALASAGWPASGVLRPSTSVPYSDGTIGGPPMWMMTNPKDTSVYVYDARGSVYTMVDFTPPVGLGDLNDGGTASGNGAAYYDNYIYFARDTTIARYGPLNGTPTFTDDYWSGTLGLTALTDTDYPSDYYILVPYPNHVMHRHSDGRLYVADVVGNQGVIHYIQTSKTTVEGDTNNGSKYNALDFGYGLWPTAIESYGSDLAIALFEGGNTNTQTRAKIAFWDTTSDSPNSITWVEFPDPLITAMKNVNGVLYVFSGGSYVKGTRISRFVGGYTWEEVKNLEYVVSPFAGAVEGQGRRLLFGSVYENTLSFGTNYISGQGIASVISIGLQKNVSDGVFNILTAPETNTMVTAIARPITRFSSYFAYDVPYMGYSDNSSTNGIAKPTVHQLPAEFDYGRSPALWWSQIYSVGAPFKIEKIRIPLIENVNASTSLNVYAYVDNDYQFATTVGQITSANYPGFPKKIVLRPTNLTGENSFWIGLEWRGQGFDPVALPITIEGEYLED